MQHQVPVLKPRVILTRKWPDAVESRMLDLFDVTLNPSDIPFSFKQLQQALMDADAVCPAVTDTISAEVLAVEPLKTRILANYGVGYNHIDIAAANSKGIIVTNTPDVLTDCTADIAIMILLMLARRGGEGERLIRNGMWKGWSTGFMTGARVTGKTLGIIGMGRIGRAVAKRACFGFGMKIIYYNPGQVEDSFIRPMNARACASIDEVLAGADFVSLHCPGGDANFHLMDETRLRQMQRTAFLINTARGNIVDESALVRALDEGVIAGAGLDVFENEPEILPALLKMENVVLLPHLGSATRETRIEMGMKVVENLVAWFRGDAPPNRVV